MLKNLLQNCKLNPTEQTIFLWLLEHGESIASITAKGTNLKRTTAYAALESLTNYGLLSKQKRNGVNYFAPVNAEIIPKIITQRAKEEYEQVSQSAKLLGEQIKIQSLANKNFGAFSIESFESVDAVYVMLEEAIMGGDFDAFFNPQMLTLESFKKLARKYLKFTKHSQAKIREIMVDGEIAQWYISLIDNPNHHVKLLQKGSDLFSDIILINNFVIINHYDPNQETCIKITEQNLYRSLKTIFQKTWESL